MTVRLFIQICLVIAMIVALCQKTTDVEWTVFYSLCMIIFSCELLEEIKKSNKRND